MRLHAPALLLTGCSFVNAYEEPGLVGGWHSTSYQVNADGTQRALDDLNAAVDGLGNAHLHFIVESDPLLHDEIFDLVWEQRSESRFVLTMTCLDSSLGPDGCDGSDFTMSCTSADEGVMACTGDGAWSNIPFDWTKDE
jgi:hypothetical protein